MYPGNHNRNGIVINTLEAPVTVRAIRIEPVEWHGHISLRMELYGCDIKSGWTKYKIVFTTIVKIVVYTHVYSLYPLFVTYLCHDDVVVVDDDDDDNDNDDDGYCQLNAFLSPTRMLAFSWYEKSTDS